MDCVERDLWKRGFYLVACVVGVGGGGKEWTYDFGSDDFAGTTPGGEAVEDHDAGGCGGLFVGLHAKRDVSMCFQRRAVQRRCEDGIVGIVVCNVVNLGEGLRLT